MNIQYGFVNEGFFASAMQRCGGKVCHAEYLDNKGIDFIVNKNEHTWNVQVKSDVACLMLKAAWYIDKYQKAGVDRLVVMETIDWSTVDQLLISEEQIEWLYDHLVDVSRFADEVRRA